MTINYFRVAVVAFLLALPVLGALALYRPHAPKPSYPIVTTDSVRAVTCWRWPEGVSCLRLVPESVVVYVPGRRGTVQRRAK